jgi:primase-polymerase (primpol)-like protein
MTCLHCARVFDARAGARFCSTRCRVAAHRSRRVMALPSALTQRDRWVLHDGRKVPRQVSGVPASSTDPATWSPLDVVAAGADGRGLGFVLNGDGICCIDLDKCLTGGVLAPWAAEVVAAAGRTYVEVSPSGRGLHVWGRAHVGRGFRFGGIEVYDRGRYMTVTGQIWDGAPLRVQSIQKLVDALRVTREGVAA